MFAQSMAEIVRQGEIGEAKVTHFDVTEQDSKWTSIRASIRRSRDEYIPAGRYAKLSVRGQLVMSDTPMERRTNHRVGVLANGDVLIAGLGLGLILTEILNRESVRSVLVVEKSADVVRLVAPNFAPPRFCADKLSVCVGDIFTWKPPRKARYDTIYFDIWPNICTDNLPEISKLHRRFQRYLNRENPDAWMDSWQRDHLISMRRRGR